MAQTRGDNITIEKTFQGAWRILGIIDRYFVTRVYFYYTKKEAIEAFEADAI